MCTGVKLSKEIPSISKIVWMCCSMPLPLVPIAMRLSLKSATDRIGELASLTKHIGPALAGATMRTAMGLVNGAVAFFARPIQLGARLRITGLHDALIRSRAPAIE